MANLRIGVNRNNLKGPNEQALKTGKGQTKLKIPHNEKLSSVRVLSNQVEGRDRVLEILEASKLFT